MGSKLTSYRTVVTIYKPTQVIGLTQKGKVKKGSDSTITTKDKDSCFYCQSIQN